MLSTIAINSRNPCFSRSPFFFCYALHGIHNGLDFRYIIDHEFFGNIILFRRGMTAIILMSYGISPFKQPGTYL